jgi:hypothetical protein
VSVAARWLVFSACVLGAAGVAAFLLLAEQATLIIPKDTPLYDRATTQNDAKIVGTLRAGVRVRVTECVDLKSYFVYRVQLPDGRSGYVNGGMPTITVEPFSLGEPIVFNCY